MLVLIIYCIHVSCVGIYVYIYIYIYIYVDYYSIITYTCDIIRGPRGTRTAAPAGAP